MNWQSISPILRIGLLLGAVCYLALILWLLKEKAHGAVLHHLAHFGGRSAARFRSISCRPGADRPAGHGCARERGIPSFMSRSSCFLLLSPFQHRRLRGKDQAPCARKRPHPEGACADWKRSSRRRINKRKTEKPRNAVKGGDSLSKNALFRQTAYDGGLWPRSPRRPSATASLYTCLGTGPAGRLR